MMKITSANENTINIEIGVESKDFLIKLLKEELNKSRNKLIYLNRIENDELNEGKTTWRSGGCSISAEHAANLMYDSIIQCATLENIIEQLENEEGNKEQSKTSTNINRALLQE